MSKEVKECKKCKDEFELTDDDLGFYTKMKVPPPTWCPECRQMRRMSFRNERNLFKRKCSKTGKDIISIFTPSSPFKVYERKYWDSGEVDLMSYGRDFDFSRGFFDQFKEFMLDIPWPSLRISSSENCEYNNDMSNCKDCYLSVRTHFSQNMNYVYRGNKSRDCVDCMQVVRGSNLLYECIECINCTNSIYLSFSENCSNSSFLMNCKNCLDCFMCTNLRNKQYYFKNKKYSREEYSKKVSDFYLGSFLNIEKALNEFEEIKKTSIRKNLNINNCVNCTGDNITNSKNSHYCFGAKNTENVKFLWDVMDYKDSMDCYSGGRNNQLVYECTATAAAYNCAFCVRASDSNDIFYSMRVKNSKNLFACIGLDNKEYCILNKQYTKEEYEKIVPQIISHMEKTKEWGEFFPMELSNFEYNNTIAQEYFPLNKKEVLESGLSWAEADSKNYNITIKAEDLPDDINIVSDDILKEVIECSHLGKCNHGCSTAFRLIPRELEFYKRMKLPIPRICPNCRHYGRLAKLNPLKLWDGKCQCMGNRSKNNLFKNSVNHLHGDNPCGNEFKTSYDPKRSEIVYCEKCYQQEIV